jgi:threonine/homoserine/homoserine lactone efflux protein
LPAFVDMTAVTWRVALLVLVAATLTIASIKLGYALLSVRAKTYLESRNALVKTSAVSAAAAIVVGVYLLLPT